MSPPTGSPLGSSRGCFVCGEAAGDGIRGRAESSLPAQANGPAERVAFLLSTDLILRSGCRGFACLALPALLFTAHCSNPVSPGDEIRPGRQTIDRLSPIEVAIDHSGVATAGQVRSGNAPLTFVRMRGPRPNLAFVKGSCWVRLRIHFQPESEERWYLGLAYPLADRIDLYAYASETGPPSVEQHGGDRLAFHARPVDHRFFLFPLQRPVDGRLEVLLRLESQDTMELPLALIPETELVSWAGRDNLLIGLYFGLLLAMLFYNLALHVWVRDRVYLLYAAYLIALALYMSAELGPGYQYLWPDSPGLQARAIGAFAPLAILVGAIFSASYLQTKERDRLAHGVFLAIVAVQLVFVSCAAFVQPRLLLQAVTYEAPVLPVVGIILGIRSWRRGFRPALYYLFAWSGLLLGVATFALASGGFIPGNTITTNAVLFGTAWEVMLLSPGLAARIRSLRNERDEARKLTQRAERRSLDLEQDLNQARAMQLDLLPARVPEHDYLQIVTRYLPREKVGGDLYGFVELANGDLGVYIADVSGHGMSAAIFSMMIQQQMDSWAHVIESPAEALGLLNEAIMPGPGGNFVTIFYAIVRSDRLIYANAGHPFPYLLPARGAEARELKGRGRLLGIYGDLRCEDNEVPFKAGDRLALYTDGAIEVGRNSPAAERMFRETLERTRTVNGQMALDGLVSRLLEQNRGYAFEDDITLILMDRQS